MSTPRVVSMAVMGARGTTIIRIKVTGYEGDTFFAQGYGVDDRIAAFSLGVLSELLIRRTGSDEPIAAARKALGI
jgi:hypothetical protein